MSKYIFVDIDGVLLPGKMHLFPINRKISHADLINATPLFDTFAVRCFNIWAKYADAKIIFSTNWASALYSRNDADITPIHKLKTIMSANGLEFEKRYHKDILTPKKFTSARGSEIWWWLMDNANDGDRFIAVDDDTSCRYIAEYMEPREQDKHYPQTKPKISGEWIQINYRNGLTWENFIDGCAALDINIDTINEKEFGIIPLTPEEKEARNKSLDLLINCMV